MKKMLVLIVCLITNLAFANSGSMFGEIRSLWEAAGKKSEKLKLHHQKLLADYKKNLSAQEQLDLTSEAIELVESELQNDKVLMAKILAQLYACKALCCASLKDFEKAQEACMLAIGFDSNNGFVYFAKGLIWCITGYPKEGAACMKIASKKGCALADEFALSYDL